MVRYCVASVLLIGAFIGAVQAQDRKALRQACIGDAMKFCANTQQPRPGRVVQCLWVHEAELSPACREGLQALKAIRKPQSSKE
jgi:hypothetical protein